MKRAWTRGEKWLWAAPLLFGVVALAAKFGPNAARRALGYPIELTATRANTLTSIALSQDGQVLVAGEQIIRPSKATKNIIHAWDGHAYRPLAHLTRPYPAGVGDDITRCVALSADAKYIVWIDANGRLTVAKRKTQQTLWTTGAAQGFIMDAAFSPDGRSLAVKSDRFQLFEVQTGKQLKSWGPLPGESSDTMQFSPSGRYFASSGGRLPFKQREKAPNAAGGEIELRRVTDWKIERVLPLPNTDAIAFSPDENTIIGIAQLLTPSAFGYLGSRLRCFDLKTGKVKWELDSRHLKTNSASRFLCNACFSPDGATVAVLPARGRQLFLLDASNGEIKQTLRIPVSQEANCFLPHALAFSPDGKRLLARGKNAVLVWDLK